MEMEDHPGFEVSSLGRVKNMKTGNILTTHSSGNVYANVRGKTIMIQVARQVLYTFLGVHDPSRRVKHIDGNRKNSALNNVKLWSTPTCKYGHKKEEWNINSNHRGHTQCRACQLARGRKEGFSQELADQIYEELSGGIDGWETRSYG